MGGFVCDMYAFIGKPRSTATKDVSGHAEKGCCARVRREREKERERDKKREGDGVQHR